MVKYAAIVKMERRLQMKMLEIGDTEKRLRRNEKIQKGEYSEEERV